MHWTLRHGVWLWGLALVIAAPAIARTVWLYRHLNGDVEELLPSNAPSVVALNELRQRVGGLEYLAVVVDAGSAERLPAAERFLDDLAARVRTYPPQLVNDVATGSQKERSFFERNAALYVTIEDLRTMRQRIEERRDYEVSRTMGILLEDTAPPPIDFGDIKEHYESALGDGTNPPRTRYSDPAQHVSVMLIQLAGYSMGADWARPMLARVRADIAALGGADAYAAGMRWGFAGDAAATVEELSALMNDVSLSSIVVVGAVLASIVVYFRWVHSATIVLLPVFLAGAYSFAIASIPPFGITALNSNTGFLGAIILGNGLNSGLILLSRHIEERRAGADVRTSLVRAVWGTSASTFAAALAATVAYGSLMLTDFRGFRQFGFVGGFGMILAWALSFLLMPPLIAWLDRRPTGRWPQKPERTRITFWVTHVLARAPAAFVIAAIVITGLSLIELRSFGSNDVETSLARLRRRDTWQNGEGYWGAKMNAVLGRYLTPFAFLTDRPEDARRLADRLRAARTEPAFEGHIDRIETIWDVLPTQQDEKLDVIAHIRNDLTPKILSVLTPEQRNDVLRLFRPDLRPITTDDLPRTVTLGLRERDGSYDKIVLVFPNTSSDLWHADIIDRLVRAFRRVARESAVDTNPPRLAAPVALSADILERIRSDGPKMSAYSFTGVVAVVLLLLKRSAATLYVAGALLLGVAWMAAASRWTHVRINFANMIAFPITFGIGVDYAVNVVSRYQRDGGTDILHAVRSTGAAVALCSLTTIIGYSSLLMARNRALFLFGVLADMGELSCLCAALVALPALILTIRARRRPSAPAKPRGSPPDQGGDGGQR